MSRRFIPLIVAAVVVIVILTKGEKPEMESQGTKIDVRISDDRDDDRRDRRARESRRDRDRSKKPSDQYALDVERANWPPLSMSGETKAASLDLNVLRAVNYYVVFDGSGSMMQDKCGGGLPKIDVATDAVRHFFSIVPADANVGLAAFDKRDISERVPLGTNNRDELRAALDRIKPGADTPLKSTIKIAYDNLTAQARKQLGYGEYHLIVVTDGKPDPRSEDPTRVVKEILAQSPVVLHTIGFCIDSDHVLNQSEKVFYASATDSDELQKSLQAVLARPSAIEAARFD